jgi:hypothetical protein
MRLTLSAIALSMVAVYADELATLSPAAAYTYEYGFSDYHFVDPDRPWHVEGRYHWVAPAKFERHRKGHVDYSDVDSAFYFTQFFNDENSLTYEIGYDFLQFKWEKNPRFSQSNFNYLAASLGFVSTTLCNWRWIVNAGFSVDAVHLDMAKSGVGHAMLWGRYHFADCCGVHVGMLGWYGILNGHAWPIIGFDWKFNDSWSANAIFPIDYSLNYAFTENWSLEAAYSSIGGPYKYPRRARGGVEGFRDPIFSVHSNGLELMLKYKFEHLIRISVGGGWDFGGWIYIKDGQNHHGKYYHYESAPYAQGNLELTF